MKKSLLQAIDVAVVMGSWVAGIFLRPPGVILILILILGMIIYAALDEEDVAPKSVRRENGKDKRSNC